MKIHKEGWPLIIMSLVFALILGGTSFYFGAPPVLYWILTFIPVGFAIFFLCFFRDPKRTPTGDSGSYLAAWHPKSSTKNERTTIVFRNEDGTEVLCRQIAGLFARRVVCYAEYDRHFKAGEQIGFIKFGSRADVFLPLGTKVNVKVGDKVTGSETVIAELQKNTNN